MNLSSSNHHFRKCFISGYAADNKGISARKSSESQYLSYYFTSRSYDTPNTNNNTSNPSLHTPCNIFFRHFSNYNYTFSSLVDTNRTLGSTCRNIFTPNQTSDFTFRNFDFTFPNYNLAYCSLDFAFLNYNTPSPSLERSCLNYKTNCCSQETTALHLYFTFLCYAKPCGSFDTENSPSRSTAQGTAMQLLLIESREKNLLTKKQNNSMKKVKVVVDFIQFSAAAKIVFDRNVLDKITNNPNFPTPDTPLTVVKTAVDKFESSYLAAQDGSRTAIAAMHSDEEVVDNHFRILAAYVDRIAAGDEVILLGSGFHLSKQPTPSTKATLTVADGAHSGSVKLIAKAVDKAGAYLWQYAKDAQPDTDAGWTLAATSTQSTYELSGLAVATKYYFRMAAITPSGQTDYTAAVLKVVV